MLTAPQFWPDRLRSVSDRIESAARKAGRDPRSIRLLAVSKQQPASSVAAAARAGQIDFGENYVQEAVAKIDAVGDPRLVWHFIGQLQSNKTRDVAERFQWVHTVDRERIARRLDAQRPFHAARLAVLLQVRLGEEPGKGRELEREAHRMLSELPIHFVGNIEGRVLGTGAADVVVTDGYTGNVMLKSAEGTARAIPSAGRRRGACTGRGRAA